MAMRRGPAGLPPGDQLLGCLGAFAVRVVWRAQVAVIANGVGAVPRHSSSFDTRSSVLLLRLVWISDHGASCGQEGLADSLRHALWSVLDGSVAF